MFSHGVWQLQSTRNHVASVKVQSLLSCNENFSSVLKPDEAWKTVFAYNICTSTVQIHHRGTQHSNTFCENIPKMLSAKISEESGMFFCFFWREFPKKGPLKSSGVFIYSG